MNKSSFLIRFFLLASFFAFAGCGGSGSGSDSGSDTSVQMPDQFTFSDITDVPLDTAVDSETVVISGIDAAATVSISNGSYSIDGGAFTAAQGSVEVNQSVIVRVQSADGYNQSVEAILTIGGVTAPFTVVTSGPFFFSANDGATGLEKWVTDGSTEGTYLIRDINKTEFGRELKNVVEFNDELFFIAKDSKYGSELRKFNAATMVSELVKNTSAFPDTSASSHIAVVGDVIYFWSGDEFGELFLWQSDGTEEGTIRVQSMGSYGADIDLEDISFAAVDGTLFFALRGPSSLTLWKVNGTEASEIKQFPADEYDRHSASLVAMDGAIYFVARDQENGLELWKTLGSELSTLRVKDIYEGPGSSLPASLTAFNGALYFSAMSTDSGPYFDLWKTDGSEAGTQIVNDTSLYGELSPRHLKVLDGALYFAGCSESEGCELWRSDGSTEGTLLFADINPGVEHSFPRPFAMVDNVLYLSAKTAATGYELWKVDGTNAGAQLVSDISPGAESSVLYWLAERNGFAYFTVASEDSANELWRSDGTESGTEVLVSVDAAPQKSVLREVVATVGDKLYFIVSSDTSGGELWQTDGSVAGTFMAEGSGSATASSGAGFVSFATIDNVHYFPASDGIHGVELWRSDGSESGTVLVKDINANGDGLVGELVELVDELVAIDGKVFFPASNGPSGEELWVSDGTTSGTQMIADINPGAAGSEPRGFVKFKDAIYFSADDGSGIGLWRTNGVSGVELVKRIPLNRYEDFFVTDDALFFLERGESKALWVSDGTEDGTVRIKEVEPYGGSLLAQLEGFVYFSDADALWRTDGTAEGTSAVVESLEFDDKFWAGDFIFFTKLASSELWRTDGTEAGTVMVADIATKTEGAEHHIDRLQAFVGGELFFSAYDSLHGTELWKSDGTATGTVLVKDIYPGPQSSEPEIVMTEGRLYLAAASEKGEEIWVSDGTASGTVLLKDINEGSESGIYVINEPQ